MVPFFSTQNKHKFTLGCFSKMWVFNFFMFPASKEQTGQVVLGFASGIICSGIEANSLIIFSVSVFNGKYRNK